MMQYSSAHALQVALKYSAQYGVALVRVLRLHHNRGKGGAVRLVSVLLWTIPILVHHHRAS